MCDFTSYVKLLAGSGGRQEVDRVNDRHRDNVFLGAEVKIIDSGNDLLSLACDPSCAVGSMFARHMPLHRLANRRLIDLRRHGRECGKHDAEQQQMAKPSHQFHLLVAWKRWAEPPYARKFRVQSRARNSN